MPTSCHTPFLPTWTFIWDRQQLLLFKPSYFRTFLLQLPIHYFKLCLLILERGERREREKHGCERETYTPPLADSLRWVYGRWGCYGLMAKWKRGLRSWAQVLVPPYSSSDVCSHVSCWPGTRHISCWLLLLTSMIKKFEVFLSFFGVQASFNRLFSTWVLLMLWSPLRPGCNSHSSPSQVTTQSLPTGPALLPQGDPGNSGHLLCQCMPGKTPGS